MASNSRMASAVHIMGYIARLAPEPTESAAIARSVKTHPVAVRRLLKALESEGLVALRRGRHGGVGLARPASAISLGDIYRAVEREDGLFSLRESVNLRCPVSRCMQAELPALFEAANAAVEASLQRTSLSALVATMD